MSFFLIAGIYFHAFFPCFSESRNDELSEISQAVVFSCPFILQASAAEITLLYSCCETSLYHEYIELVCLQLAGIVV